VPAAEPPQTIDQPPNGPTPGGSDALAVVGRALPWIARLSWLLVAVVGGTAIEAAVDDRSSGVRWVAAIGGWGVFALVALALVIPAVRSLTASRVLAPLSLGAVVATIVGGAGATDVLLLAIPAVISTAAIFTADVGRWMVQSSAYGGERRLLLRPPVAVGAAAVLAWFVWAATAIIGPLALGAANLAVGIPLAVIAFVLAVMIGPRWHKLSRRWFVLVPAGVVLHDPVVMADTVMIPTAKVANIALARADTEAADLTGPASGYAVEVRSLDTITAVFAFTPKEPNGRAIHMTGFLIAPTRPGELLRLAGERGLPVG